MKDVLARIQRSPDKLPGNYVCKLRHIEDCTSVDLTIAESSMTATSPGPTSASVREIDPLPETIDELIDSHRPPTALTQGRIPGRRSRR
jgi:hypothetical protein